MLPAPAGDAVHEPELGTEKTVEGRPPPERPLVHHP